MICLVLVVIINVFVVCVFGLCLGVGGVSNFINSKRGKYFVAF